MLDTNLRLKSLARKHGCAARLKIMRVVAIINICREQKNLTDKDKQDLLVMAHHETKKAERHMQLATLFGASTKHRVWQRTYK